MANILNMAADGTKKTQLMYRCNLSFKQMEIYLNLLTAKSLMSKRIHDGADDVTIYETTAKGHSFLRIYDTMNALLSP